MSLKMTIGGREFMKRVARKYRSPEASYFGRVCRLRREELHIKQEALAIAAGYKSRSAITNIEAGLHYPTWEKALAIAKYLRLPITAFEEPQSLEITEYRVTEQPPSYPKLYEAAEDLRLATEKMCAAVASVS
jgi:transcriptional regulator with XRE-family HTH domain